jgi:hypothetical protein
VGCEWVGRWCRTLHCVADHTTAGQRTNRPVIIISDGRHYRDRIGFVSYYCVMMYH